MCYNLYNIARIVEYTKLGYKSEDLKWKKKKKKSIPLPRLEPEHTHIITFVSQKILITQ